MELQHADRKPLSYSKLQQIYPTDIEKGIKHIDFIYNFSKMPTEFVVVDIETTGLDSTYDRIIEIATLKYKDGKIIEEFNQLINPEMPIPDSATRVNGITNNMVNTKSNIFEVIDIIFSMINGELVVGYNVKFDIGFIDKALARDGRCIENIKVVDVLDLVKGTFSSETNDYKLATMKEYFGIVDESHRALSDCRTTLEVMKRCIAAKDSKRLETVSKFNEYEKAYISILEQRLHEIGLTLNTYSIHGYFHGMHSRMINQINVGVDSLFTEEKVGFGGLIPEEMLLDELRLRKEEVLKQRVFRTW
ncbi:3'-5' exonuclease [Paenibacillus sp. N3/727]|uniref:3'-5' exonuclease n=1 Tax=Paenibacillus sp. N3/727 TaxID=2925845 RepID=UPI001F535557|nr:3'-5' exonuclease [Paenibacillus sp. N3/727]UNK20469.1 3'-5' exonuclease [Paenibacillus sp. N3/727]